MNRDKLSTWLEYSIEGTSSDRMYRVVLLEENLPHRPNIIEDLKQYIFEAHDDFRKYYRGLSGLPLSPFGDEIKEDLVRGYPGKLDMDTLKGYFGEVFAALITQNFAPFGIDNWEVPAFLFRNHRDAFYQLLTINRNESVAKTTPGRTGDDFIAFQRDSTGRIRSILYGEAKCNYKHRSDKIGEAFKKAAALEIVDLALINAVLKDQDNPAARKWIVAIEHAILSKQYKRYNLVSYACSDRPTSPKTRRVWLPTDGPHELYTSKDILEAVEAHLHEIDTLVREVYPLDASTVNSMQPEPTREDILTQPDSESLMLAARLREVLAGSTYPKSLAKLYSQHTLLGAGRAGLNWTATETEECLNDALRLIEAALIEKEGGSEDWQNSARRAGNILEWLSHPLLNIDNLPTQLLSAAAYQLAGYPAISTGLLNTSPAEEDESQILTLLLKADFRNLLSVLVKYWAQTTSAQSAAQQAREYNAEDVIAELNQRIVSETIGALGILCAFLRWGEEPRLDRATSKLKSVGNVLLHSYDPYSWLLAKLCAEVAVTYTNSSKRHNLTPLIQMLSPTGVTALERYLRQCYLDSKALAWPSQVKGIEKLIEGKSFVLSTPTGSGKTTIAELAILQSLFTGSTEKEGITQSSNTAPLVIYLVPSRALAAEVESALSRVLRNLNDPPINVTGLYGGTDWGPTDAWLTSQDQTVLICTPEKAEALIRFLGPYFPQRVSLLVVDEAHSIQFDPTRKDAIKELQQADNRPLRLEALCSRLFTHLNSKNGRIVALSAVAKGIERTLTEWVTGEKGAAPASTSYRSTRQLIGRLECLPERRYQIVYDLLDGANLKYVEGRKTEQPYIPDPILQLPPSEDYPTGAETRFRPYLFWAAINLASLDAADRQHSVLISLTQHIDSHAKYLLDLLEKTWSAITLPTFFQYPRDEEKAQTWEKCLRSCKDYFGEDSHEYKLLQRGIAVHHGRMPGLYARLLTDAIQDQTVYLVIATSTLSDGVNLPFETILIPSLFRGIDPISEREFGNLAGRSGRPGYGTEGRTLVLLDGRRTNQTRNRTAYDNLVKKLLAQGQTQQSDTKANSPLAQLLTQLESLYKNIPGVGELGNFQQWLEQTAPLNAKEYIDKPNGLNAIETLDTLDSFLLSCIVEAEQLEKEDISQDLLEERLREIWQRSYARYAASDEKHLEEIFLTRGKALKDRIYPTPRQRRRLYHTSLPPRHGNQLLELFPSFKQILERGRDYGRWNPSLRLKYIQDLAEQLFTLPKFKPDMEKVKKASWQNVLQWWLNPTSITFKTPVDASDLYKYISYNFLYHFNWGLGSMVAVATDNALQGAYLEPSLDNWPILDLPWVVLWLKELIIWGTLEPVAAYLLSKNMEETRAKAESAAEEYYKAYANLEATDELLNAATIKDWATKRYSREHSLFFNKPDSMAVKLAQDFGKFRTQKWKVFPARVDKSLHWYDPSGTILATCGLPSIWSESFLDGYDFTLDPEEKSVSAESYTNFRLQ